jgi:hypothetical protein
VFNKLPYILGYVLFVLVTCVIAIMWVWSIQKLTSKKIPYLRLLQVTSSIIVLLVLTIFSPYYIGWVVEDHKPITMEPYGVDTTPALVHYGNRPNDFFWTQKSVGELKQKTSVSLNINGESIFSVYVKNRELCVDAKILNGFSNDLTTYRTDIFTIELDGYFDTKSSVVKYYVRKQGVFEETVKEGAITATLLTRATITTKALAPPIEIRENNFVSKPDNCEIYYKDKTVEFLNEKNIPVLVLKRPNPYEITIEGLFRTPYGILKVDNSHDVVFEFADTYNQLSDYKVDRAVRNPFLDWLTLKRTFNLAKIYEGG